MKKCIYIVSLGFVCAFLISCSKNAQTETVSPDISGTYNCSFSVSPSGMKVYNYSETVTIIRESAGYKVSAPSPLQDATMVSLGGDDFQFRVPNTTFSHDSKQCFINFTATLKYNNGSFNTSFCQISFGEYGVSGKVYDVSNFKLTKK